MFYQGTREEPENRNTGSTPPWNMMICSESLKTTYVNALENETYKQYCLDIIKEFEEKTLPILKEIEAKKGRCWIHSDVNDLNLIVNDEEEIIGVIDFDDLTYSFKVIDIGISMMYATVKSPPNDFMRLLRSFYKGYTSVKDVSDVELSVLYNICQMRFVQSVSVSAYQSVFVDPGNKYLTMHGISNKTLNGLNKLLEVGEKEFLNLICS